MENSVKFKNFILATYFKKALRVILHLIFWVSGYFILLRLFSRGGNPEEIDYIYTAIFLVPLVISTYLNLSVLIPFLLKKGKILLFAFLYLVLILLTALVLKLLFDRWIDFILKDYYFISYDEYPALILYALVFTGLSALIKISIEWFQLLSRQKEIETLRLESLQSQVNPHFLLNSLQTIYSLSLENSTKTSETILELSEVLKFTIYESKDEMVLLKRELEVMENYVKMQRLRTDAIRASIDWNVEGTPKDQLILPLLFLPFIENSFKHGLGGAVKNAFVDIHFKISGKFMTFTIVNNTGETDHPLHEGYIGMGIENTRKRLMLFYPSRHKLDILKTKDSFSVKLELKLSKK